MAQEVKWPWIWREDPGELIQSGAGARKSYGQGSQSIKAKVISLASVQSLQDRCQPDRKVTLEDIKVVAVNLVSERSLLSTPKPVARLFDQCYRTDQMNYLLWTSVVYYDAYQHHSEASKNESLAISGASGNRHKQALKSAQERLGLEHWSSHHSLGGRSRVSKTHTDQKFFEILYEFVMLSIWICFGYNNWEVIHKELGRVFRTSAFNRDYRPTHDGESVDIDGLGLVIKSSDEYIAYRVHYERPPVGSLKCLRSPALENIMPSQSKSERDCSKGWLCSREIPDETEQLGIIGHKLSEYDPESLKPLTKSQLQAEETSETDADADSSDMEEQTS